MITKTTLAGLLLVLPTVAHASFTVGINDYPIALGGDADYQDLIVSISGAAVASSTGTWQQMPAPNESGTLYWSGISYDGPQMNIGYWLTGTGGFTGSPSIPDWSVAQTMWYGNADGTGVPLLFSGSAVTVTVEGAISADSASNIFGYSYATDPSVVYPLFVGGEAGLTVTFDPNEPFELYLQLGAGTPIYGSDTTGEQHFAVFVDPPSLVTPEPATLFLAMLPLVVLLVRKRWASTKSASINNGINWLNQLSSRQTK
jgi:hypothetical protein